MAIYPLFMRVLSARNGEGRRRRFLPNRLGAGRVSRKLRLMVCEHLSALEQEILTAGVRETFRGAAWTRNCREWVYFDCWLDLPALRARFTFAPCVVDHTHRGTHDGSEAGFFCETCKDAIMGVHDADKEGRLIYA